jgi:hypothetical protein
MLYRWGNGELNKYIGGRFVRVCRKTGERIEGVLTEIKPSRTEVWKLLIAGTEHPVQRIDLRDYDDYGRKSDGTFRFGERSRWDGGGFKDLVRVPHKNPEEIILYPAPKKREPKTKRARRR